MHYIKIRSGIVIILEFYLILEVACPALPGPENGKMHMSDKFHKSIAHFDCDEGFIYSQPKYSNRECLADGTWSGVEGTCDSKSLRIDQSDFDTIRT